MTDPSERDIAGELREAAMACAKEHPRLAAAFVPGPPRWRQALARAL